MCILTHHVNKAKQYFSRRGRKERKDGRKWREKEGEGRARRKEGGEGE